MKAKVGITDKAGVVIHTREDKGQKEKVNADSGKTHDKSVRQKEQSDS